MNVENELLQLEEDVYPTGLYIFSEGKVEYRSEKLMEGLLKVTFDLRMDGRQVVSGIGYYDRELKKMIKWIEKN